MNVICPFEDCTGCGACSQVCPQSCVALCEDGEGFLRPTIDGSLCVDCGLCKRVCPALNPLEKGVGECYSAWHRDETVLSKSSSGGAFTALADIVLEDGGIVFGAEFDEATRQVYQAAVEDMGEIDRLRMSKYYQGLTRDTFTEVATILRSGRTALYTGTGCQIAGLRLFLDAKKVSQDQLITAEVLCHGCPSKKVVDSYIASMERSKGKVISTFRFRTKDSGVGWSGGGGTQITLFYADGTSSIEDRKDDPFFVGFNANLFLRESCYRCRFAGPERVADFTMADFWGVTEKRASSEQQRRGISLLMANTENARALIPGLESRMHMERVSINEAAPHNLALVRPNKRPECRSTIYKRIEKEDFSKVIHSETAVYYAKRRLRAAIVRVVGEDGLSKIKEIIWKVRGA